MDLIDRLQRLQGYLAADPQNYPLLCEIADLCLQLGDSVQARPLLEQALAIHSTDPQLLYKMAVLNFFEKNFEASRAYTEQLLANGERNPFVQFQHAQTLVQLGEFGFAEPILAGLVALAEPLNGLQELYVRTLHYLGKLEEATSYAESVLRDNPENVALQGMLSLLYLDQEQFSQAQTLAQQTLQTQPNNLDALIVAGSTALAYEKEQVAQDLFEQAVALSPRNGRSWLGLGLASMAQGNLSAAQTQMKNAVTYMPEHLGSWNTLAWVQILQKDFPAAQATLSESLRINDKFGETYGSLAVVAAFQGEWEEVAELSKKAVRLQPDSFAGRFAQSLLIAHRGRPQQAQAMLEGILNNFTVPGGGTLTDLMQRVSAKSKAGYIDPNRNSQHNPTLH